MSQTKKKKKGCLSSLKGKHRDSSDEEETEWDSSDYDSDMDNEEGGKSNNKSNPIKRLDQTKKVNNTYSTVKIKQLMDRGHRIPGMLQPVDDTMLKYFKLMIPKPNVGGVQKEYHYYFHSTDDGSHSHFYIPMYEGYLGNTKGLEAVIPWNPYRIPDDNLDQNQIYVIDTAHKIHPHAIKLFPLFVHHGITESVKGKKKRKKKSHILRVWSKTKEEEEEKEKKKEMESDEESDDDDEEEEEKESKLFSFFDHLDQKGFFFQYAPGMRKKRVGMETVDLFLLNMYRELEVYTWEEVTTIIQYEKSRARREMFQELIKNLSIFRKDNKH